MLRAGEHSAHCSQGGGETPGRAGAAEQLTSDREVGRALRVARVTGIVASILLLSAVHPQLGSPSLLHHLVLGTREELQGVLAPLHTSTLLAQLTAQVGSGTFIHLLGLQLPEKAHRCSYREAGQREGRCRGSYGSAGRPQGCSYGSTGRHHRGAVMGVQGETMGVQLWECRETTGTPMGCRGTKGAAIGVQGDQGCSYGVQGDHGCSYGSAGRDHGGAAKGVQGETTGVQLWSAGRPQGHSCGD